MRFNTWRRHGDIFDKRNCAVKSICWRAFSENRGRGRGRDRNEFHLKIIWAVIRIIPARTSQSKVFGMRNQVAVAMAMPMTMDASKGIPDEARKDWD
jgi:hypothetical protein